MKGRDWGLSVQIEARYEELLGEMEGIASLEEFSSSGLVRKAVIFDILQIGELANHFSESFASSIGRKELSLLVGMRNRIVHGYGAIDDAIVYQTLENDLPSLIKRIVELGLSKRREELSLLLGRQISAVFPEGNEERIPMGFTFDFLGADRKPQKICLASKKNNVEPEKWFAVAILEKAEAPGEEILVVSDEPKPIGEEAGSELLSHFPGYSLRGR